MGKPAFTKFLLGDVGTVFYTSVLVIVVFVGAAIVQPEAVERNAESILNATVKNFGWMYLLATTSFVLFGLFLALSKYGSTRLGADDESLLRKRLEWLLLRESEREAARLAEEAVHPTVPEEPILDESPTDAPAPEAAEKAAAEKST